MLEWFEIRDLCDLKKFRNNSGERVRVPKGERILGRTNPGGRNEIELDPSTKGSKNGANMKGSR